ELGRSAADTFGQLVFVSGHGGNAGPVRRAVTLLRSESRDVRAWFPSGYADAHAGRSETSLQLAADPSRVRLALADAGTHLPLAALSPELAAAGVAAVSPNGVLGDPGGASAEEGAALLGRLACDLLTFVDRVFPAADRFGRREPVSGGENP